MKVYVINPEIGNRAFVDHYDRLLPDLSYRVENRLDPIVHRPQGNAPFPYNLQLMIPNVDFVRDGENYHARSVCRRSVQFAHRRLSECRSQSRRLVSAYTADPVSPWPGGLKRDAHPCSGVAATLLETPQNIVRAMFQEQTEQLAELQVQLAEIPVRGNNGGPTGNERQC